MNSIPLERSTEEKEQRWENTWPVWGIGCEESVIPGCAVCVIGRNIGKIGINTEECRA